MPTPGSLHHVELYVSSLEDSLRFWEPFLAHFGYRVRNRFEDGVSIVLGDCYIVLVQAPSEHLPAGYHRRRVGLNHLAFHAASRAQVDEIAQWVRDQGYTLLYGDRHPYASGPDYYALYCEDPDRMKVEVAAPRG